MASIGQITNTIIDSGTKHIIPARVSYDVMVNFACNEGEDATKLLREKMKYCSHKDDMLLSVGGALFEVGEGKYMSKQAYPPVVSTLAALPDNALEILLRCYGVKPGTSFEDVWTKYAKPMIDATPSIPTQDKLRIQMLPWMTFMGYSLGTAYAHPSSGDTAVSTLIGGLHTVRNGAFSVKTGDRIMWYFDIEAGMFNEKGQRVMDCEAPATDLIISEIPQANNGANFITQDGGTKNRLDAFNRQNGNIGDWKGKRRVFLPKPFFEKGKTDYPMDRIRVFAKALNNARPYDMLDIQICTQCI